MCGIAGFVGIENGVGYLLNCLERMEYRGYDSAGIATITEKNKVSFSKVVGKTALLRDEIARSGLAGTIGIAHTRWATHGAAIQNNAHPHCTDKVSVVHNGIIENYEELRTFLHSKGITTTTETDTEVIVHLLDYFLIEKGSPEAAMKKTLPLLRGSYAFLAVFAEDTKTIYAARKGSPLIVGYADDKVLVASDLLALTPYTDKVTYLEDNSWGVLAYNGIQLFNQTNKPIQHKVVQVDTTSNSTDKGDYSHYMLKEIHEQPDVIRNTFESVESDTDWDRLLGYFKNVEHINIIACGTSYHTAMVAKYWLEEYAGIFVNVDIASEFRYRKMPLKQEGLSLFISQSGETADTLSALSFVKQCGHKVVSIVNVPGSSIARESDFVLLTKAGTEVSVASTKAFVAQLMVLLHMTIKIAEDRGNLSKRQFSDIVGEIHNLPAIISNIMESFVFVKDIVKELQGASNILFAGRGEMYPIALEGALKLKEVSYIQSTGIAGGELKHGTLALIDDTSWVIAMAPSGALFDKIHSNIQAISARGGNIIVLGDEGNGSKLASVAKRFIRIPRTSAILEPILYVIPLQLIAYHVALSQGHNVDQPRNLAKSVTVE